MRYQPDKTSENLLHETNSSVFLKLADIHNRLQAVPTSLTRGKIIRSLPFYDISNREHDTDLVNAAFCFDSDSTEDMEAPVIPPPSGRIPILPSHTELRWLKTMLENPKNDFLLSDALREKLLSALKDIPAYPLDEVWQKKQLAGEDTAQPNFRKTLSILCRALREQRNLSLRYRDWRGTSYQGTVSPCRLEYNTYTNRFHLLAWEPTERHILHMGIAGLSDLRLENKKIPPDTPEQFENHLKKLKKQAELTLTDTKNAKERCYAMFAAFDKTAFIDKDGLHHLSITYYRFEREEVIRRILSLGPAAILKKPEDMRHEIARRLQEAWKRCGKRNAMEQVDETSNTSSVFFGSSMMRRPSFSIITLPHAA
ncbi:MAG: WYL domain-containing protein [Selenomonadaceae bacterium]|nr:WYL domain-containing protein [Selenomonadaceae bacterium]